MIEPVPANISNCPKCEFGEDKSIRPLVVGDGICLCRNCGNRWRVIDSDEGALQLLDTHVTKVDNRSLAPKSSSGFFAIFAVVLVVSVFFSIYKFVEPVTHTQILSQTQPLTISDLSVENFKNTNTKIWVVSGEIRNNSDHKINVPSVVIFSGEKGSSGYFSRTYYPALQILAPGAKFRFRTSFRKPVGGSDFIKVKFTGA
jgi:hypothetical protein